MLLTMDPDGRPRAAAERELVSLLWPAPPGERFALLVDGVAQTTEPAADPRDGGLIVVRAVNGVLHVVGNRRRA